MALISSPIRLDLVEGSSAPVPESVVEFSESFNQRVLFDLKDDAVPAPVRFDLTEDRYLDTRHLALKSTFDAGSRAPGTYRGTAVFRPCLPAIFVNSIVGCNALFQNAAGAVPYEIVIREITTTFLPSNNLLTFEVGRLLTDVPIKVPYNIEVTPSAPFGAAFATLIYNMSDKVGYSLNVSVPSSTPSGTVLTGNLFVKICRDDPRICAFPHKDSPFNLAVSYTMR